MEARIRPGSADGSEVIAEIEHQYGSEQIYFRSQDVPLEATPDALIPLALIPAMYLGEPLVVHGGVSPTLLANVPRIQELMYAFEPILKCVEVKADAAPEPWQDIDSGVRGSACFFSGGVDSTYSTLRHLTELDGLVFIRGFDAPVRGEDQFNAVVPRLHWAAQEFDQRLIEVETNLKDFSNRFVDWPLHYYGAALATVGHVLRRAARSFYMAGGYAYELIPANGAHPMLDPLWGSDATQFVYDGGEATRSNKMAYLAASRTALSILRVCTENTGNYNCGRCKKCLLTMAGLRAMGVLEQCSFESPLDLEALGRLDISHPLYAFRLREVIEGLDARAGDPALEKALMGALLRASLVGFSERSGEYSQMQGVSWKAAHGQLDTAGGTVTIQTPRQPWAYAARMRLSRRFGRFAALPRRGKPMEFLRVRMRVEGSSAGVGVTTRDGKDFIHRLEVRPSDNARNIYLRLPEPSRAGDLIVQSWNLPRESRVTIESVEVSFADIDARLRDAGA
jgi:hypothetical protein